MFSASASVSGRSKPVSLCKQKRDIKVENIAITCDVLASPSLQ